MDALKSSQMHVCGPSDEPEGPPAEFEEGLGEKIDPIKHIGMNFNVMMSEVKSYLALLARLQLDPFLGNPFHSMLL